MNTKDYDAGYAAGHAAAEQMYTLDKALLGTEVQDEPWYHNIPKEGVDCWVDDDSDVEAARDAVESSTRTVYSYDPSEDMPFEALMDDALFSPYNMLRWKYAIPVDPALRLPNGAIIL